MLFTINLGAIAQLKLDNAGNLTVGPVTSQPAFPNTLYGSTYIKNTNGSNYLQIDIWPAATRLASHYDQVVFYNTAKSLFNSIQVANVYNYSDAKAKTNIQPLGYGLNIVKQLKPVSYNFLNKSESLNPVNQKEVGLLAQDVEKIIPELVLTDTEGKKLLNYTGLIPILIKAVQDLQAEVELLKQKK
ncbi:MAG: tail fiber domain-containing protein [Sphingobacteriales bacterium]|nr:tail fiber domain-containing protein [Sphingobacteriales bacterium]